MSYMIHRTYANNTCLYRMYITNMFMNNIVIVFLQIVCHLRNSNARYNNDAVHKEPGFYALRR